MTRRPASAKTPSGPAAAAEPDLTADEVATAIEATVHVPDGETVIERVARPEDILSWRRDGHAVIAVTVDGRKHRAEIAR